MSHVSPYSLWDIYHLTFVSNISYCVWITITLLSWVTYQTTVCESRIAILFVSHVPAYSLWVTYHPNFVSRVSSVCESHISVLFVSHITLQLVSHISPYCLWVTSSNRFTHSQPQQMKQCLCVDVMDLEDVWEGVIRRLLELKRVVVTGERDRYVMISSIICSVTVIKLRSTRCAGHEARMEEREHFGELGANGVVILGQIFKELWVRTWTEPFWIGMGFRYVFCCRLTSLSGNWIIHCKEVCCWELVFNGRRVSLTVCEENPRAVINHNLL